MSVTSIISKVTTLRRLQTTLRKSAPRSTEKPDITRHWKPQAGPQDLFFHSDVREILFGGAAGGGKSSVLVATAAKWIHDPTYNALILRRETTQLNRLLREAQGLYAKVDTGADENLSSHTWRFSSGARIRFNHCQHEKDARNYQGDEFQYIGFDELTHFTESQYLEVASRLRSTNPRLPRFIRAATNPGGEGHEWVFKRWGAWLDPEYEIPERTPRTDSETGQKLPPAEPGEVLWFLAEDEEREQIVPAGTPKALSRTFIPAKLSDNKILMDGDPEYEATLNQLDPVRRKQLKEGDWLTKPAAGAYFKRQWFEVVEAAPVDAERIRYWDRAASENKGDWTRGVRLSKKDGIYYVEHVASTRSRPNGVEALIKKTAEDDGVGCQIGIEQDPGQAGVFEADSYVQLLAGYDVRKYPVTQDKITRARPVSAQVEAGNIRVVRGHWNAEFFAELEAFPDGDHDDQVDALSGAFARLGNSFFII